MNDNLSLRFQLGAAWAGPLFVLTYGFFWGVLGHNIPPIAQNVSAADLAAFYAANRGSIRLGMMGSALLGALWLPWTAQCGIMMARIEGKTPLLSIIHLLGGGFTVWILCSASTLWAHATYRPQEDAVGIQTLHEMAWFVYDVGYLPVLMQIGSAGLIAFVDKGRLPLFPKWTGWLSMATVVSSLPLSAVLYIKEGPFSWDGAYNFFYVFGMWLLWFTVMSIYMIKAIRRQIRSEGLPT